MKLLAFIALVPMVFFGEKIAIVTVSIGDEYYEATFPGVLSKQKYAALHGYDFICFRHAFDITRHAPWQKIKAVETVLKDYDWVFWSDADSMIMNDQIRLEDFIDENYHFILSFDNVNHVVNSGEFLIKNSEKAFDFLQTLYSREEFINHMYWENGAIIDELERPNFRTGFAKILDQRAMNAFASDVCWNIESASYQNGDFIVHFPGVRDLSWLKNLMQGYLE